MRKGPSHAFHVVQMDFLSRPGGTPDVGSANASAHVAHIAHATNAGRDEASRAAGPSIDAGEVESNRVALFDLGKSSRSRHTRNGHSREAWDIAESAPNGEKGIVAPTPERETLSDQFLLTRLKEYKISGDGTRCAVGFATENMAYHLGF